MKKVFIILFSAIAILFCSCERTKKLDELLKNDFGFKVSQKTKSSHVYSFAMIYNRNENIKAVYSDTYSKIISKNKTENALELTVESSDKIIRGDWPYWDWVYPMKGKVILTPKNIKKITEIYAKYKFYDYLLEEDDLSPSTCNALIITDNLRVRSEPNLDSTTKIISKLNKWDDVHLVDCTKEKTKIDNLEYPWYKVQLENGQEGWIFGGFAKIYFSDRDKEDLHKAFEKEGSEYTNQFVTPEGFY